VESKVLNFPEAMKLAQILSKYIDTESIKDMTGEEFIVEFFSRINSDEITDISNLLGISLENITSEGLLEKITQSLIKNDLPNMLDTYRKLGLK
jgi:hypothetical protein